MKLEILPIVRMTQKVKAFCFSKLDTIMETTEIEDSNKSDCLRTASPRKHLASSLHVQPDAVDAEKTQQVATLRRKRIALPSTRIRNRIEQKDNRRWTSHKCSLANPLMIIRDGEEIITDGVNSVKAAQNEDRKLREIKQVKILFPEFFPKRTSIYLGRQCDWIDNYQKNMEIINGKASEDPLVQSWLNLFGPYIGS